ncbi:50S ribosomal protein L25 [Oceanirhabdus seepicola]|uniref:Large ribosomal subunit protein bL25 n=1 Tax=Oceanirhabdus seepicola TaxID=2828781 RepID=A0A9J6P790_9CLOT|nr:50S ribosomal protein L25 [Oceanirhabdus seepicola]MCM1992483.1 50S ribosomal protein L25 [Oceanirhabdus seepicola]
MNCLNLANRQRKKRSKYSIPGVMYGKNKENFLFEIGEIELDKYIKEHGEHGITSANINGSSEMVLIKEVQRDSVKHNIIHIDLESIDENKEISTDIPIYFDHEKMVRSNGGILQKEKSSIRVKGRVSSIPEKIKIDVANMRIGDMMRIADLEIAEDLTFMEPLNSVVMSVTHATYIEEEEVDTVGNDMSSDTVYDEPQHS